jgi:acyl-homoserine-lactone acylase
MHKNLPLHVTNILLICFLMATTSHAQTPAEAARWKKQAAAVTIIRDSWGIPHIYGKTDADAVFGLLYAQCEDDFARVEMNYIEKLGRMAEVQGKGEVYNDLVIRMLIDSADAVADYQASPPWMKQLMNSFADGINFYLYTHPDTRPLLLKKFKPWYALLWTDGSIGAISTGGLTNVDLQRLYNDTVNNDMSLRAPAEKDFTGSNGFAIAPSRTSEHHSLLYINPHVSFYFRPEVHMVSEQGLNVYGAVTWGQFFIYQGFNEHCGWMHTSSNVDVADVFKEQISGSGVAKTYLYDGQQMPVKSKTVRISYRDGDQLLSKTFPVDFTGHGPVMGRRSGTLLSLKSYNRSLKSLMQSWLRTKATSFAAFSEVMDMRANTSNNTVYADGEGNIAYWHGNFVPIRDTSFDWALPVDGTTSNTEWKGLHQVNDIVHIQNPSTGFLQNCNSTPFSVAGSASPDPLKYPAYMAPDGENFRGINAVQLFSVGDSYNKDSLIKKGYNTHLSAFDVLIPALIDAYGKVESDTVLALREPIDTLAAWNRNSATTSVATTVAIFFGQNLQERISAVGGKSDQVSKTLAYAKSASPSELIQALRKAIAQLTATYGTWKMPWGEINRYQRLTGQINERYDDALPSIASGMASSTWGCLPSFVSRQMPGTKKRYGYNGNSFICAVEFGPRITAKSLLTGGESGNPLSSHFNDQAQMYTTGNFKTVNFYKEDVLKSAEKTYHPGAKR